MEMAFDARKSRTLCDLESEHGDRSRKGGVDAPILHLINRINLHRHFFTTSSCSGRITLFLERLESTLQGSEEQEQEQKKKKKKRKGGDWLFVSHDAVNADHLIAVVTENYGKTESGLLTFRYEPFILALECLNVDAAQELVSCAISSGFRESGITSCKNRVIVAIRCSIRLEVPIAQDGELLVSLAYLRFLTTLANDKMVANHRRTEKFFACFSDKLECAKQRSMPDYSIEGFKADKLLRPGEAVDSNNAGTQVIGRDVRNFGRDFLSEKDSVSPSWTRGNISRSHIVKTNALLYLEDRQKKLLLRIRAIEKDIANQMPNRSNFVFCKQRGKCSDSTLAETKENMTQFVCKNFSGVSNSEKHVDRICELEAHFKSLQAYPEQGGHGSCRVTESKAKLDLCTDCLHRWSHTACTLPATTTSSGPLLLVFGGYGGFGRHSRLNDLLLLDCQSHLVESVKTDILPRPRMAHTACIIDGSMWVIGGREDPHTPLGDILVLHLGSFSWKSPKVIGDTFRPRYRHAAAAIGSKIYVFGGLSAVGILKDMYVLDTIQLEWSQLTCEGEVPDARHSHTLAAVGETIFLFGGYDDNVVYGDLYMLDLGTLNWKKQKVFGDIPCGRFSHSCTVMGHHLVFIGGCTDSQSTNEVSIVDTTCMLWKNKEIPSLKGSLLVRHTTSLVGNDLVIIGGGLSCYAFGTIFNSFLSVDGSKLGVSSLHTSNFADNNGDRPSDFAEDNRDQPLEVATFVEKAKAVTPSTISSSSSADDNLAEKKSILVMELDRTVAKICKDALKELSWLDPTRRAKVLSHGKRVVFPLNCDAQDYLKQYGRCSLFIQDETYSLPYIRTGLGTLTAVAQEKLYTTVVRCLEYGGKVYESCVLSSLNRSASPRILLQAKLSDMLEKHHLPNSLGAEIPKRWERLGDMAILPSDSLTSKSWRLLGNNLWTSIADCLGVKKVARQGPIAPTGTRDSTVELLLGENGWVEHRENGMLYGLDATKCMFSSGNVSERLRIGKFNCKDETVIDLFAGIGYFVLPFLLKAGAEKVYACEWNPNALVALRHNLKINFVEDRCMVIKGDNRRTSPQGIANRVCLGLLPSSEESWEVAVKALRPEGGMLHVHGNVKDGEEVDWANHLLKSIKCIAQSQGLIWSVAIIHIERVKWYAPRIRHLVADVKCLAIKEKDRL